MNQLSPGWEEGEGVHVYRDSIQRYGSVTQIAGGKWRAELSISSIVPQPEPKVFPTLELARQYVELETQNQRR